MRSPSMQVGAVLEVVSHWLVSTLGTLPALQVGVGLVVEVDSHWPVVGLRVPVSQVGSPTTNYVVMGASSQLFSSDCIPSSQDNSVEGFVGSFNS